MCGSQRTICRVDSFPSTVCVLGSNSGHWAWQQMHLPTELAQDSSLEFYGSKQ